jgi:hypothetical protein
VVSEVVYAGNFILLQECYWPPRMLLVFEWLQDSIKVATRPGYTTAGSIDDVYQTCPGTFGLRPLGTVLIAYAAI